MIEGFAQDNKTDQKKNERGKAALVTDDKHTADEKTALAHTSPNRQSIQTTKLVQMQDVSVAFPDQTPVLRDVNFTLHSGESVLVLGPSGCGKSTFALVLAGLLPRSVEAVVTGSVQYAPSLQHPGGVGYVFQDPEAQFCMIQVQDEIAFGLENLQVPSEKMDGIIKQSLHQFGLKVDPKTTTSTLSGGMKQKLALACAFGMNPSLYILDEPTANLDPASTAMVFEQVERLIQQGETVVVIEHKFEALLPFMERVVLIDRTGRLYRSGPTNQVIAEEWDWLIDQGVVLPQTVAPSQPESQLELREPISSGATAERDIPILSLLDGGLRYGKHLVWQGLSFSVARGEWVAIVGENGAGKSSLLSVLAGLIRLTEGEVRLDGQPLKKFNRRQIAKQIAFVFQNPEHQFIYEKVTDEIHNRLLGDNEPDPEVLQLMEAFGLQSHQQASPFSLSQGQKRRLSVASMLRDHHDVYLLDEPTFGQDARTQQVILSHFAELHRHGAALLMTTHDMEIVQQYATRVLVIGKGRLLYDGVPSALLKDDELMANANLFARRMGRFSTGKEGL